MHVRPEYLDPQRRLQVKHVDPSRILGPEERPDDVCVAERDRPCHEGSVRVFVEVRRALDLPEGGSGVVAGVDDSGCDTSGEQEADGEAEPSR